MFHLILFLTRPPVCMFQLLVLFGSLSKHLVQFKLLQDSGCTAQRVSRLNILEIYYETRGGENVFFIGKDM